MRAFIAIELDPELKESLQNLIRTLKRKGGEIRWVKPNGMHLTLKFLGEIDDETVPQIVEAIRAAVSGSRSFPLAFSGTGVFPNERKPRVLWIGLSEQPMLMTLQTSLEKELASLGFPPENRPFHPHLTLGRVKGPAFLRETVEKLEEQKETVFGGMKVERLTLFQSVLKPEGAEYRIVSDIRIP